MATPAPAHASRVFASPWEGVHAAWLDSGRHFGKHFHGEVGIGLVDRGAQRSASGRGLVDAFAGNVIGHNPGEVHDGRPLAVASRRWRMLYLAPAVFAEAAGVATLVRPVMEDRTLATALARLFACLAATPQDPLACEEALLDVLAPLRERPATAALPPEPAVDVALAAVRDRLAAELLAPPSLAALAAQAGMSRFQLLRRFRACFGLPPHAWVLQQRLERARGLIRRGMPLSAAAADVGFADQSHMTRLFGRQFGYTPGAWQRAIAFKT